MKNERPSKHRLRATSLGDVRAPIAVEAASATDQVTLLEAPGVAMLRALKAGEVARAEVRRRLFAVARAEAHVMAAAQSLIQALEVIQAAGADLGPISSHPAIGEIRKASTAVSRTHALVVALRDRTPGS